MQNTDDQKFALKIYAQNLRYASKFYFTIKNVCNAFNGKVFNCRFEKALNAAHRDLHCEKRFSRIVIFVYEPGTYYHIDLASISLDDLIDGKRIDAEKLITSAREKRISIMQEAADIERTIDRIDEIKDQIEQLKKAYNGIADNLPSKVSDVLNIHHLYRWN